MKNHLYVPVGLILALCFPCLSTGSESDSQKTPDYGFVFENPDILSFDIAMTTAAYEEMQPEQSEEDLEPEKLSARSMFRLKYTYVKGMVTVGDEVYPDVGVRYRGNASMMMIPRNGKKPVKFDFDRFVDGQTFHGFTKLNFINCFRDPSMLRDKLTYDLMQRAGIPASHATFANLYLTIDNGERQHLGLFVIVEQVDSVLLQDRFGNSDGLLVKGEINDDLEYRGDDWESYAHDHELKSNSDDTDTAKLIEFVKFVHQASDASFGEQISNWLNVDRFLAALALNTLLVNLDSYAGLGHNWYLYYDTQAGRFEHIPWDVNEAFGNLQLGTPDEMLDFSIHRPYVGDKILIRRLLDVDAYRELYLDYVREYADGLFSPLQMHSEIDRLHTYVRDAIVADSNPIYTKEDFEASVDTMVKPFMPVFSSGIIGLKPFVTARVESVQAQLVGDRPGHKIERSLMDRQPPPPPPRARPQGTEARYRQLKGTLEKVEMAIEADPTNPQLHVQKGEVLGGLTQVSPQHEMMEYAMEISGCFEKAIELDPDNVGGHMGRGMVRFLSPEMFGGNLPGAMADFEFVVQHDDRNVTANLMLAMGYRRQGNPEKAAAQFKRVLELDPGNAEARKQLKEMGIKR